MHRFCAVMFLTFFIGVNSALPSGENAGSPKKQLSVVLKLPRSVFRINDEIKFTYRITNLTNEPATFVFDSNYSTDVMRIFSDGVRCTIVRKAWKWPWFKKVTEDAFIALAPGETKERHIIASVRRGGVDTSEGVESVKGVLLDFTDVYIGLDVKKKRVNLAAAVELKPNEDFAAQGRRIGYRNVRTLEAYSNEIEFSIEM